MFSLGVGGAATAWSTTSSVPAGMVQACSVSRWWAVAMSVTVSATSFSTASSAASSLVVHHRTFGLVRLARPHRERRCDHGKVFVSDTFVRACDRLGISVQPARKDTPTDKGVVEATFTAIKTLFAQHYEILSGIERSGATYASVNYDPTRTALSRSPAPTSCGVARRWPRSNIGWSSAAFGG